VTRGALVFGSSLKWVPKIVLLVVKCSNRLVVHLFGSSCGTRL
jgi:hypothetical protein